MKQRLAIIAATLALLATGNSVARDDHLMFPLADALGTPAAKEKLDPKIKLYFADQKHPAVVKDLGEWRTNKKTNAFNKTDKAACEWTFLSAVLELQERVGKEGGDAVIEIKSNYKNIERSSETEYMCGCGAMVAGVALKGKVVKLNK
jgi:hypothetical protein